MIHTKEQLLKWLDENPAVRPCVKRALDQGGVDVAICGSKWLVHAWNGPHRYYLTVVPSHHENGYGEYVVLEDLTHAKNP